MNGLTERSNLVQSKKFRQALEDAMLRYANKAITTAEIIARLSTSPKNFAKPSATARTWAYPRDLSEDATQLVLKQAKRKLSTANAAP
jgi:hypothetical protein